MISTIMRYYHTLKFLRWTQIKYRLLYQFKKTLIPIKQVDHCFPLKLQFLPSIKSNYSWHGEGVFEFLNIRHQFQENIDWNHDAYGKLWTYNLNYFEFLSQPLSTKHEGIGLIHDFINKEKKIKDGMEPFPISLRTINWIKFLVKHHINDNRIHQSLYHQLQILSKYPEYHLLGNHLLENSFSLLFGGVYFEDAVLLSQAEKILFEQLNEQVLADGGHFELSPMYHQIMLFRLLDCINLIQSNKKNELKDIHHLLVEKSTIMLGWLKQISFENGDLPNVNDSIPRVAPQPEELFQYAKRLGIQTQQVSLKESGYRKIKTSSYEMLIDVGHIGPDYIPGHAHSDTFSFLLYLDQRPFIVDTGISTYEKNKRRNQERSTAAHNTVMVEGVEQSEVWGGFRVARRANVISLEESQNKIVASHNGYDRINCRHERTFLFQEKEIGILDKLEGNKSGIAFFHFHPKQTIHLSGKELTGPFGVIQFENPEQIKLESYQLATGFNQTIKATRAVVEFRKQLHTKIILP